ncbi:glycine cleavage system protein R [Marinomonas sp. CT5]|uniref:glycine cleavage system protein R n=1 Tax=Marinomonas sp. CT5 TaxID=2066133 RepID=UPI00180CB996|nr:ACT domain-containing protein [Marinomonas sp. CT5]NVK74080.1 glycine cleavage system protein R [Oceanospirillaceae bacterium]QUX94106.1 glycine cleavage system protein R [Marinomonas sp. CT5]
MTQHLVLSFIGDDRPGLVERLSDTISRHHGNWLESRMAHLADKFAGILTLSVPLEHQQALVNALRNFEELGLHVTVELANLHDAKGSTLALSVVGNDRPGIVKEVSQVLHSLMVNVKELTTTCEPAPMSSDMLFKTEMVLVVPNDLPLSELETSLEKISSDLMVELSVKQFA